MTTGVYGSIGHINGIGARGLCRSMELVGWTVRRGLVSYTGRARALDIKTFADMSKWVWLFWLFGFWRSILSFLSVFFFGDFLFVFVSEFCGVGLPEPLAGRSHWPLQQGSSFGTFFAWVFTPRFVTAGFRASSVGIHSFIGYYCFIPGVFFSFLFLPCLVSRLSIYKE